MARKKALAFTEEELKYLSSALMASCLKNNVLLLIDSGADASPEIGKIIMHLAKGSRVYHKEASEASQKLYLNAVNDSVAEERLQLLESILNGESK